VCESFVFQYGRICLCFNSVINNIKLVTVVLEDYKLKIKVIALAFVFLIGCIDSYEVNNVFGKVCDISSSCKSIIVIVITNKVR
jgi:hypothetical protein